MDFLVLVIEAIICVASFVIADYMVTHRTGLAKAMLIGEDPKSVVSEMRGIATTVFYGMKEKNTNLKDYTISVTVKDDKITKSTVETEKTIVTFTQEDGEIVTNKGFTERGATIYNTVFLVISMTLLLALCVVFF